MYILILSPAQNNRILQYCSVYLNFIVFCFDLCVLFIINVQLLYQIVVVTNYNKLRSGKVKTDRDTEEHR